MTATHGVISLLLKISNVLITAIHKVHLFYDIDFLIVTEQCVIIGF